MISWKFTGQPTKDFPAWLIFNNFARTDRYLIIHQFEGRLVVNIGDVIHKRMDGYCTVERL